MTLSRQVEWRGLTSDDGDSPIPEAGSLASLQGLLGARSQEPGAVGDTLTRVSSFASRMSGDTRHWVYRAGQSALLIAHHVLNDSSSLYSSLHVSALSLLSFTTISFLYMPSHSSSVPPPADTPPPSG